MANKEKVLVVDDNNINCAMLEDILGHQYDVIVADNGKTAFEKLAENNSITAILLDLIMPVMDGYEFLQRIETEPEYRDIPVIVVTVSDDVDSEKKALELGAWDFVTKPYDSEIIKFRLKNAIERSQFSAFNKLKYLSEYDKLTGIYNRNKFYDATSKMLIKEQDKEFVFIRFDISRFSLINAYYGSTKGDELLIHIADNIKRISADYDDFTYGRIESDVFVICFESESDVIYNILIEKFNEMLKTFPIEFDIVPAYGIYKIENHYMDVSTMLDYASMATKHIKGNYFKNKAVYSDNMRKDIEGEQEIINEMSNALKSHQFCVYLQPKYDINTNMPVGAEALVRWKHPSKGMISPGVFIPVFERNGFISKLDFYVWEEVVKLLRKWIDNGEHVMPVSVNISRVNIYNSELVNNICELVDRYNVPRYLLNLELTESAYTEDPMMMKETLARLHEEGFTVLMDDFGSGYSSLNILKDIKIDILKIDMEFFRDSDDEGRGRDIIASVVNMAKCLQIPSIAEGVEKREQIEFLREIGCEYVQGFYYSRPLPVEDFVALIRKVNVQKEADDKKGIQEDPIVAIKNKVSQISVAAGVYTFSDDEVKIIYANSAFGKLLGYTEVIKIREDGPINVVAKGYRLKVHDVFNKAVNNKCCTNCEYQRNYMDGSKRWINLQVRYIDTVDNISYLICVLSDITQQKEIGIQLDAMIGDREG